MSGLRDAAAEYLAVRRAVGFELDGPGRHIEDFVSYMEARGETRITTTSALEWAERAPSSTGCAARLSAVRLFARYVQASDPATEVPPAGLLRVPRRRRIPYLFSEGEVLALMRAARTLEPEPWGRSVETILGLLWSSGMRVGEVLRLDRKDVSLADGLVTVWLSKFDKSRHVPIGPSAVAALADYARTASAEPKTEPFFSSPTGSRVNAQRLAQGYHVICAMTGVPWHRCAHGPRLSDLRHSFAVRTLLGWYRESEDVQALLPRLSTYLGHKEPASTYWYLSAAPELLALAAERLEMAR